MAKTRQARPTLLTINAAVSILSGAAGTLLFGYGFSIAEDSVLLVVYGGPLLIMLTMLRWGLAVLNDRPTMAYFPGCAARVGLYGRDTGILTLLVAIPASLWLIFTSWEDPFSHATTLAYLLAPASAVGMIAFASRIDRGSPDHKQ